MVSIDLSNKRALVTGANSGIGEAVALALAGAGADVAVNYLDRPEEAERVAGEIRDKGRKALAIQTDVSDERQVDAMFGRIDAEWDGLDILVNNAGIDGPRAYCWESETDAWRTVLQVNLFGAYYCARQALKRMVPRRQGAILNMSSVHEIIPWAGYSAYAAAKAGLSMMTKTLALETAPHGVRVLAIAPGAIRTPINDLVWKDPEGLADLNSKIPMGRMGEREEIAKMAAVLVSDAASYATGTTLFVDGGMTNYPAFAQGG